MKDKKNTALEASEKEEWHFAIIASSMAIGGALVIILTLFGII